MRLASLLPFAALIGTVFAGQYKTNLQVSGPNPSRVTFNLYEPSNVKPNAPVVVALHWGGGSAEQAYQSYGLTKYADQYGFVVIYPKSTGVCWDVNSSGTLKHDAGGDAQGVVSMVKQVISQYKADPTRVFATGFSCGAMMTNVLLGSYPDVFAAGAANSGVPFGCCSSNSAPGTCDGCSSLNLSGDQWAQRVRNAYPSYSGWRPKMLLFHGANDNGYTTHQLEDEIKQWTTVIGISSTPVKTEMNTPNSGWTHTVYGSGEVEAYKVANMGHDSFGFRTDLIPKFFDLTCPAGGASCYHRGDSPAPNPTTSAPTSSPAPTSASPTTSVPTTKPSGSGADKWGQCGGIGWNGPTTCKDGKCVKLNDYYSQCQ